MTAAEVKASPFWPADVTATEDVEDTWCPHDKAYLLRRAAPEVPIFVTNPWSTTIAHLYDMSVDEARALFDASLSRWLHGLGPPRVDPCP